MPILNTFSRASYDTENENNTRGNSCVNLYVRLCPIFDTNKYFILDAYGIGLLAKNITRPHASTCPDPT